MPDPNCKHCGGVGVVAVDVTEQMRERFAMMGGPPRSKISAGYCFRSFVEKDCPVCGGKPVVYTDE